jgi:myo-inositol-1(or 4)-monophosphatase
MKPTQTFLESLARRAGKILNAGYDPRPGSNRREDIGFKGVIDLVTEIDHRSEEFIISEIRREFPHHRIIAEESGEADGSDCCGWIIDPIDGTVNYAHGIPFFCVSIAYVENGRVKFGVVYDPLRDECFQAELGLGATLNGQPIKAASTADLGNSLLATGFPYDIRTNPENNLDHYSYFSLRTRAVRRLGSAALDICYVACGRFDGYWESSVESWDIAAGTLIAEEAGARVTNMDGDRDYFKPPLSLVVANPTIHSQILRGLTESQAGG